MRQRLLSAVCCGAYWAILVAGTSDVVAAEPMAGPMDPLGLGAPESAILQEDSWPQVSAESEVMPPARYVGSLSRSAERSRQAVAPNVELESAQFPKASQVPDTEIWWKFGGYIKGDLIHDFQPAGTVDRFVPVTIPTDGEEGQNTLLQAKATRLNLDVRTPSTWGVARGFIESDFFTSDSTLRIRHAYAEVGPLLVGQTWSVFTDPNSIPRTLDFESPIAFITLRQAQFRWTYSITEDFKWAMSAENPTTAVDDVVLTTISGVTEQPIPDFATHLKYETDFLELFAAGLFRHLAYRPDIGATQDHFGWASNFVAILHPTERDSIMAQYVFGSGLGRYRSGSDLGLESLTTVDTVRLVGGCISLTHDWTDRLSSTAVYSVASRRNKEADPPDAPHFASYFAANLIWELIDNTTMGIEYLYGTNESKDESFGFANRLQFSVQYNLP